MPRQGRMRSRPGHTERDGIRLPLRPLTPSASVPTKTCGRPETACFQQVNNSESEQRAVRCTLHHRPDLTIQAGSGPTDHNEDGFTTNEGPNQNAVWSLKHTFFFVPVDLLRLQSGFNNLTISYRTSVSALMLHRSTQSVGKQPAKRFMLCKLIVGRMTRWQSRSERARDASRTLIRQIMH